MNKRIIGSIVLVIIVIIAIVGILYFYPGIEPVQPYCGDGICSNDENCTNCPEDCGPCPPPEHCGNGRCEPWLGENCQNCEIDCGECPPDMDGLGFRLPYNDVHVGDSFYVDVYLDPDPYNVGGWKLSISYDPTILQADYVVSGNEDIWVPALFDGGVIDNGIITYIQSWTAGACPNYKMDLCTIRFTALTTGNSALSFAYVKITDSNLVRIQDEITGNNNILEVKA